MEITSTELISMMKCRSEQAHSALTEWYDWRWQIANAITSCEMSFPMRVTPYYASLADLNDPNDPILRQFMPDVRELEPDTYSVDPFEECGAASIAPGMKQRFPDRLLAMVNTTCSTYCRHCTRRGLLNDAKSARLEEVVEAVKARPNVREVLLSGGDPMLRSDDEIVHWVETLSALQQLDAIRLCTRTPVVLPMRWTDALVKRLAKSKRLWVQTQFNHPRELTSEAIAACERLVEHGIPVSNQSVLLRGINDDPEVMVELCAKLQRHRIRPYYLFLCDPIAGIQHFRTDEATARRLRAHLLNHLGGLACPRVVADLPNATHKTDL